MNTDSKIKIFLAEDKIALKHLMGQHNQATHGRRGASAIPVTAGKKPKPTASEPKAKMSPKYEAARETVSNRLLSGYKNNTNQPVEFHVKVYTNGKYDISKSYRVYTVSGNVQKWLDESLQSLTKLSTGAQNSYTLQNTIDAGGSKVLSGEQKNAQVRYGDLVD